MDDFIKSVLMADSWNCIRIYDRNHKTHTKYKDLYLSSKKGIDDDALEKYRVYSNYYNKTYAFIKTLLDKDIRGITLRGKHELIDLKEGKLKIDITARDVIKHYDNLFISSGERYRVCRNNFLDKMISKKRSVYLFKDSEYKTSYEPMLNHGCVFNMMFERAKLLGLKEEDFILEAVPKILSLTSSCVEENHELRHNKNDYSYKVVIENNDLDICISKISDKGMEKLKGIIDKHNEKCDEKSSDKKLVLGGK